MVKTLRNLALLLLGVMWAFGTPAPATTGTPPVTNGGPALQDSGWLLGLAGGQNYVYQYALTAAGTNQATAAQMPCGVRLVEADTVTSGAGFALCPAYSGTQVLFYNNGANTVTLYPSVNNNPLTAAQDTINNTTSITVASHTAENLFCAKNGVWAAK